MFNDRSVAFPGKTIEIGFRLESMTTGEKIRRNTMTSVESFSPNQVEHQGKRHHLIIACLVSALVLLPIMIYGIPYGGDLFNHFRFALPLYDSIRSGIWYPGWLAESNAGLGDPRFRFYPPGLYYLMSAIRFVTGGWYSSGIVSIVLLSILGAIGAYFWARNFFPSRTSMWVAIFYSIAPYRLNEVYQAAMLSEFAACSVLPFAFAFIERICRRRDWRDIVGLGVSYALIILTNLPIAVIASLSLATYALVRIDRKQFVKTLTSLAGSVALGLAASAFFWFKMITELSWINGNSGQPNIYYDYRVNFLFSPSALTNRNTWYANLMALAIIGFVLPAVWFLYRLFKSSEQNLKPTVILFLGSFFMATALSWPIWAIVPKLYEIQFPWRWLAITSLASAPLLATCIRYWGEQIRKVRPRDLAVLFAFVLSLGFIVTQQIYDCRYLGRQELQPLWQDMRGAVSFKDWLPIWGKEFLKVERMNEPVKSQARVTTVSAWEPQRRVFDVQAGQAGPVQLRTYYYPLWGAQMNGKTLTTSPTADGLLLVNVPAEAGTVEVVFQEPSRVGIASKISAGVWLLMISGLLVSWLHSVRTKRTIALTDPESTFSY